MRPEKVEWDGMGNQWTYICPSCEHSTVIEPIGRNAITLSVGIFALAFLAVMNVTDRFSDWTMWVLWGGACLIVLYFPVKALLTNWKYSVSKVEEIDVQSDVLNDPLQKAVEKAEKLSFIQGLFSPIGLIVVVLGLAFLYGYFIDG
jgi:hypothetical protein